MLGNAAMLGQLTGLPLSTVLEAEQHLAGALGGDTGAISALRVLQLYLERLGCNLMVSWAWGGVGWVAGSSERVADLAQPQPACRHASCSLCFPPRACLQALHKCQLLEVMALTAVNLARKAGLSPSFVGFRPSVVAAACLLKARQGLGLAPAWPRTLQSMTAYLPSPESPLQQCLDILDLLGMSG